MKTAPAYPPRAIWSRLEWLGVFAVAMGLLEAICVIYLRRLLGIDSGTPNQLPAVERLRVEVIREGCTIVMLLAVAWLAGINLRSRIACFFYAFGIWDMLYYAGLWWLAGWPTSWLQWDCLFLIPKPWYGPVLAPVLISLFFIVACAVVHHREIEGKPLKFTLIAATANATAAVVWYWSFVKDSDQIAKGSYGGVSYSWVLFALALAAAIGGLWLAARGEGPVKQAVRTDV